MKRNAVILTAMVAAIATSFGVVKMNSNKAKQVAEIRATYAYNVDDVSSRVGFSDYVFVGEIIENVGTEYRHYAKDDNGNIIDGTGSPYTEFRVKIIDNVKGELVGYDEITVYQAGGLSENKEFNLVYEGDELMQEGNTYIIETSVQPDGTLLASGAKNNTKINVNSRSGLDENQQYQAYLIDADNAVEYERERFEIK